MIKFVPHELLIQHYQSRAAGAVLRVTQFHCLYTSVLDILLVLFA